MFSTLRTRFGIPGVISVMALVFAMLGGAYAANNSSGGGKATASAKAKKGPRGPKGATGPAGPQGPAGAQGAPGANGKDGSNGSNGSNGASGKPVVTGTLNAGQGGCVEGGAYVEVKEEPSTKKSVCNGEPGANGNPGATGSPWTLGGTLPPSSAAGCPCTETGTWSTVVRLSNSNITNLEVPISFPIPLGAELNTSTIDNPTAANQVHYVFNVLGVNKEKNINFSTFELEEVTSTACTGSTREPKAAPGNLCIYEDTRSSHVAGPINNFGGITKVGAEEPGAGKAGAILKLGLTEAGGFAYGSWAVTGG